MPRNLTLQNTIAWLTTSTRLASVVLGAVYGICLRMLFKYNLNLNLRVPHLGNELAIMSEAFLFVGPAVIGFLTVRHAAARQPLPPSQWILLPWISVGLTYLGAAVFLLEGTICLLFALPLSLLAATLGGIIGGLVARHSRRPSPGLTVSVALLPFLLAPAESLLPTPTQTRTVQSRIRIHAPASVIWHNIERVPAITPAELRPTWPHRIGFPRPVEATLSFEGVGGVRHATFEHGLLFLETVNVWQPDHRLAFSIRADTAHIPPTTLDEHVTIGGRYFDVLDGEYRLEPLAGGDTLLHLTSHQRLSTDFNGYAGLWSDAVMQNLQTAILEVIQHRCETRAVAQSTPLTP